MQDTQSGKRKPLKAKSGLTQRAVDGWDSARFSSIFLASGFLCFQALSTPTHPPLTQTVGTTLENQSKKMQNKEGIDKL